MDGRRNALTNGVIDDVLMIFRRCY